MPTIHDHIYPHGYSIGGILESDPFSTKDLALALRAIGRGYSNQETDKVRAVFAEYVQDVGADTGTVIKITNEVFDEVGKEGVPNWVLQQLETFLGSDNGCGFDTMDRLPWRKQIRKRPR